jgi:glycosyltransferase involved in cell wall biosynthesis
MVPDSHTVSVVIPTLGRESLQRCLEALKKQTRPPNEVIVVRDEQRRGVSWGRNEGVRRSRGDLVAFTDDDCVPPPEWIEQLVQAMDRFNATVAGGLFVEADPFLQEIRARRYRRTNWQAPEDVQLDTRGIAGSGGSIMYRRSALETWLQSDGYIFNEAFRMSQDWELASRLRARGATFAAIPALVVHARAMGPGEYLRQQFGRGRAIAKLYRSQRAGRLMIPQESLLWSGSGSGRNARWGAAVWAKLIGPWDRSSFSSWSKFWLFWLGEKIQSAGFLWSQLRREPLDHAAPASAGKPPA